MASQADYDYLYDSLMRIKHQIETIEANSPKGEYGATGCSGAGCTQRPEPGVRGPAQILAELRTFMESHPAYTRPFDERSIADELVANRDDHIFQYLTRLIGTEGQDAP